MSMSLPKKVQRADVGNCVLSLLCLMIALVGSPLVDPCEAFEQKLIVTEAEADGLDEQAFNRAIAGAQARAVERAIGTLIPHGKIEANRQRLLEEIIYHAEQYTASPEVTYTFRRERDLSNIDDLGSTTVGVRQWVGLSALKDKLSQMELLQEIEPTAVVILVLDCEVDGVPFDATDARSVILNGLAANAFRILESDEINGAFSVAQRDDSEQIDWVLDIGKEFSVDYILLIDGKGVAQQMTSLLTMNLYPCRITLTGRMVDIRTGTVSDMEQYSGNSEAELLSDSAAIGFKDAAEFLSMTLLPRVRTAWRERYHGGNTIQIELSGINYSICNRLLRELRGLSWVNSARRVKLVGDSAVLSVTVRDDSAGLANTLIHLPNVSLELVEVSANKIVAKTRGPKRILPRAKE